MNQRLTREKLRSSTTPNSTRRSFLKTGALSATAIMASPALETLANAAPENLTQQEEVPEFRGKIYKSVKWGMIKLPGATVKQKFELQKELGYDGMELNSPTDLNADEVRAASAQTGMPVHGVVDMKHWEIRLSSPDQKVRAEGTEILKKAIQDCKDFGGDSVLLVPGRVTKDATHDDVWKRSIVEIRKVLPTASRLGVRVLIENVWNGFCEQADQMRDYLDEINSPWVGLYFDIGNVRKFSPSEDWVRTLGNRIVKLDVKGWSTADGFKSKIGEGDVNWPEVRKALKEIGFTGWCTAEIGGGGKEHLKDTADRLNKVLAL